MVVRLNRAACVGGPAEFLFPVEVENPDFGKPLEDPAYQSLKAKVTEPKTVLVSLRRAPGEIARHTAFPREAVCDSAVRDTCLTSSTAHWDSRIANYGGEPTLKVGNVPGMNGPARGLIAVELGALPKGAKILGAQLRLTLLRAPYAQSAAGAKLLAYAVRREWRETPVDGLGASWYGAKYGGNPSHPHPKNVMWGKGGCDDTEKDRFPDEAAGADAGGFPAGSKDPKAAAEKRRLITLDITALVRQWASGELANHGLLLVYNGGGSVEIASSEFQDYPFRPTLVVAYEGGEKR